MSLAYVSQCCLITCHAVTQEASAECLDGASLAAQKYGPPLVGRADTISAIVAATTQLKNETTIQLVTIVAGPPVARLYPNNVMTLMGELCDRQSSKGCRLWRAYQDRIRYSKALKRTQISLELLLVTQLLQLLLIEPVKVVGIPVRHDIFFASFGLSTKKTKSG